MPRQCGIATFTTDLREAISGEFPESDCFVVAMNDGGRQYAYPQSVRHEIAEADVTEYLRAADFLNVNEAEILCLQRTSTESSEGKREVTFSPCFASCVCRS